MRFDAGRRGDRQGQTRSHICEKSLMPLARTTPSSASPFTRIWNTKASSLMVLRGELSPTTANHDFKQQVCNANTEKSSVCQLRALNPQPEGRGPSRYPVAKDRFLTSRWAARYEAHGQSRAWPLEDGDLPRHRAPRSD